MRTLAFSPDGGSLASGSDDGTVRIWDTSFTGEYHAFRNREGSVSALSKSRDGTRVASAEGPIARVWQTRPTETLARTEMQGGQITSLALNADGSALVAGAADGAVRILNIADGSPPAAFTAHKGEVKAVAVDSAGGFVATGSADHTIRVWDMRSNRELRVLQGHTGPVTVLAVSVDHRLVLAIDSTVTLDGSGGWSYEDSVLRIYDGTSGHLMRELAEVTEAPFTLVGDLVSALVSDVDVWGRQVREQKA